jgi:hypothetical protein
MSTETAGGVARAPLVAGAAELEEAALALAPEDALAEAAPAALLPAFGAALAASAGSASGITKARTFTIRRCML